MIRDYIAVDVETTGLNPARDRLLEIGAARILNGKVEETYQTFIDAGISVSGILLPFTQRHKPSPLQNSSSHPDTVFTWMPSSCCI